MKLIKSLLVLWLMAVAAHGQSLGDTYVTAGQADLYAGDYLDAQTNFQYALSVQSTNAPAKVLLAAVRLLSLPQQPAGSNFLNQLGFSLTGRTWPGWHASLPKTTNGSTIFPANYNSSAIAAFVRNTILPSMGASATNLAGVQDPNFSLPLSFVRESSLQSVTLDYGDVLMLRSLLALGQGYGNLLTADNLGVVLPALQAMKATNGLSFQSLMTTYPTLLTYANPGDLATARSSLTNAVALYLAASDFIRHQRAVSGNPLFWFDTTSPKDLSDEFVFRTELTNVLNSLNGPVAVTPVTLPSGMVMPTGLAHLNQRIASLPFQPALYLGSLFNGANPWRGWLPQFTGDSYVRNSLPDYTLGGLIQGVPAALMEKGLRSKFHGYTGIYLPGPYGEESVAMFVDANSQVQLLDVNSFDPFPTFSFPIDPFGNFVLPTNGVLRLVDPTFGWPVSWGRISRSGWVSGSFQTTNFQSVWFNNELAPDLGPCQASAGYYFGTSTSPNNARLSAILAASGEIYLVGTNNGGANFGLSGYFTNGSLVAITLQGVLSTNDSFYTPDQISAKLNGQTISGRISGSSSSSTFSLSRVKSIPFDTAPVITSGLTNITSGAGNNVTLTVVASGSAPLCYEWQRNGQAIPGATTASLTLTNVSAANSYSQYSVTVLNAVGKTNTSSILVVRDTLPPTVNVTNLVNNQMVGNSQFTVAGSASDASGVAGVWYQFNNGPWTAANSTNGWTNWTANLNLLPGTNTLRTYATDLAGQTVSYVADNYNNVIREIFPAGLVTTLAGNTNIQNSTYYGFADGPGTAALFNSPSDVAVDRQGNVFVADAMNNLIRKITPAGVVTTLAGDVRDLTNAPFSSTPTNYGFADGVGTAAKFASPYGIIVDPNNNLYVADSGNNLIRKITPAGVVTTVAGDVYDLTNAPNYYGNYSQANLGYADGTSSSVKFNNPGALALDAAGNLFVADSGNNLIRKITPAGVVSTVAGDVYDLTNAPATSSPANYGFADGLGTAALFSAPYGILVDSSNNVFVADTGNNLIREISPAGLVTTIAGDTNDCLTVPPYLFGQNNNGYADGPGSQAIFNQPGSLSIDPQGNLYVSDVMNNLIRKITPAGVVSTVAGDVTDLTTGLGTPNYSTTGYADGIGSAVRFNFPEGIVTSGGVGNTSATNVLTFAYLPSVTLQVAVNGPGTVTPNLNNAFLQAGTKYSLTAVPSAGCVFTNWTSNQGWTSNGPALTFVMQPNLVITANFADRQPPVLVVTNLPAGLVVSNGTYLVAGTATDNLAVASVLVQVNGGGYQLASGTNRWTYPANLLPGTNLIQSYAMDTSGNVSATNSATLNYVLTSPLTIVTNGLGTLSPNLAGQLLRIGTTYSLAATPAIGFSFGNWMNSLTGTGSNSPTLTFTMQSNLVLTATFKDVQAPTLTITNPAASGLLVSNASYTLAGKAADNWQVASVLVQVNGGGYQPANGTLNWTYPATLVPGTNTLQAYAVDSAGNHSLTNATLVNYVRTAPLTLLTNGLGTFTPNSAGQLLRIGTAYSIAATPATGFSFGNWTNGLTGAVSNSPTLTFTMQSNLVLTATFKDVQAPTLTITNPAASGLLVSNASYTLAGKAADNWQVASVLVQLNGGGYQSANGTTNWNYSANLVAGTNLLQAYAVDTTGNHSLTNATLVNYVRTAPLTLLTNGLGTFTPNSGGQLLRIGTAYTIAATPATGFSFGNWTNGLTGAVSNSPTLTFTMQSNLVLTATFKDTQAPTLTITNPAASGLLVSNASYTLAGKAADNWQVASVLVQLNGGGYQSANGTTNWNYSANLVPGTNLLQAYAVDTTGNRSLTNATVVNYVRTASLTLLTNGLGTLSPNLAGQLLRIGTTYSLAATPASGFTFGNWTNGLTGAVSNSPTLTFTMQSNLVLIATFAETNRPSVVITNLPSGTVVSNAVCTIGGTATDSWALASVQVNLNGTGWVPANGLGHWSQSLTLNPGTNTVQVYAVNGVGLFSPTNTVTLVYRFLLAGTWNIVQLHSPALMTLDANNGLTGGDSFSVETGQLTINSPNTFTGLMVNPYSGPFTFTGTYSSISNGVLNLTTVSPNDTNTFTAAINASQDTMVMGENQLDANNNSQTLTLIQRAPVTESLASLAGGFNVVIFSEPALVTWNPNSGLQTGDGFNTNTGNFTVAANGTLAGNVQGNFTGKITTGTAGALTFGINPSGDTGFTNAAIINASLNTLNFARSNATQNELGFFLRTPTSVTLAQLAGTWNAVQFETPATLSGSPNQGGYLSGGDQFSLNTGSMNISASGALSGNFGDPFTGTVTLGAGGVLHATTSSGSGGTETHTLYLNASLDTMALVEASATNNWQHIMVFLRAPK